MFTDDFDVTVAEFMDELGTSGTYVHKIQGEYDPATGQVEATLVETPVQVIVMDLTLQSNGFSTKYGTLVEAGDKEIFVRPPVKSDPTAQLLEMSPAGGRIIVGSIEYKIVSIKSIDPTGASPIIYSLYVRR